MTEMIDGREVRAIRPEGGPGVEALGEALARAYLRMYGGEAGLIARAEALARERRSGDALRMDGGATAGRD